MNCTQSGSLNFTFSHIRQAQPGITQQGGGVGEAISIDAVLQTSIAKQAYVLSMLENVSCDDFRGVLGDNT